MIWRKFFLLLNLEVGRVQAETPGLPANAGNKIEGRRQNYASLCQVSRHVCQETLLVLGWTNPEGLVLW